MKRILSICLFIWLTCFSFFHLLDLFMEPSSWENYISFLGILIILFSLILLHWKSMLLPITLILCSLLIVLFSTNVTIVEVIWYGSRQMRALIVMLFIIPFVGWVLKQEKYIEALLAFFRKQLNSSKKFYAGVMWMTQITTYFLLFGSVSLIYQFFQNMFKGKIYGVEYKTSMILRGFSLSTLWVISTPSLAYMITVLDASLGIVILQGVIIAILGTCIALFIFFFEQKRGMIIDDELSEEIDKITSVITGQNRLALEFIVLMVSLITGILIFNTLLTWNVLTIIPIVVFFWTLLYFILKKSLSQFVYELKHFITLGMAWKAREFSIIMSAGLLVLAINESGWGYQGIDVMYAIIEKISFLNFLWFLPLIVLFLSLLGLMPSTIMVLMAGILQTITLPYSPELIVLSLSTGTVFAVLLSPLIVPSIIISSLNGRSSWKNSFQSNWKFALLFYIITQVYIQFIQYIGG